MANEFVPTETIIATRRAWLQVLAHVTELLAALQKNCKHNHAAFFYDADDRITPYKMACPVCGKLSRLSWVPTPANWPGTESAGSEYRDLERRITSGEL